MIRRPRANRSKAVHGRVWKLRGNQTWEAQIVDENGQLQKICITCPPGVPATQIQVSHSSGFQRRIGDTGDMIGP